MTTEVIFRVPVRPFLAVLHNQLQVRMEARTKPRSIGSVQATDVKWYLEVVSAAGPAR
jgi:hypothetical protein